MEWNGGGGKHMVADLMIATSITSVPKCAAGNAHMPKAVLIMCHWRAAGLYARCGA